jgi:hypothetical protein
MDTQYHSKPEYAVAVDGAVGCYAATMFVSAIFWIRAYTSDGIRGAFNKAINQQ